LISGISFLLQFKQISGGTLISVFSQWREAYCHYKSQNQLPGRNAEKLSAMNVIGIFTFSSLQWAHYG
jgi:hypothetical protein